MRWLYTSSDMMYLIVVIYYRWFVKQVRFCPGGASSYKPAVAHADACRPEDSLNGGRTSFQSPRNKGPYFINKRGFDLQDAGKE